MTTAASRRRAFDQAVAPHVVPEVPGMAIAPLLQRHARPK